MPSLATLNDIAVGAHLAVGATNVAKVYYPDRKLRKVASALDNIKYLPQLKVLPDTIQGRPAVEVHLGACGNAPGGAPMTESDLRLYSWGAITPDDPRLPPSAVLLSPPAKQTRADAGAGARKSRNQETAKRESALKLAKEVMGSELFTGQFEWAHALTAHHSQVFMHFLVSAWETTDQVIYASRQPGSPATA
jgi:hypothetical protein